jgi:hypothetical protein
VPARLALTPLASLILTSDAPPPCGLYRGLPDAWALCAAEHAPPTDRVDEAVAACETFGTVASACTREWALGRAHRADPPARRMLLPLCAGAADCAFQLLDALPATELDEQIAACVEWAPPYQRDCIGHAAHRWTTSHPSADSCLRMVANVHSSECESTPWLLGTAIGCGAECKCAMLTDGLRPDCEKRESEARAHPSDCQP